jgi:hypothetical protein
MASSSAREAGIAVMMRPWAEETKAPPRPAAPKTAAQRFWRTLAQFIFDYNRY